MKTATIMCCGSYYSPWFPYTVASTYAVSDFMVVVNAGFDFENPSVDVNDVPLKQVTEDIRNLDIENKIIEVTDVSRVKHKLPLICQKEANDQKIVDWYDLRGRNMTLASEVAYDNGAKMVIRIDTDQVCYKDVMKVKGRKEAMTFYQYEFEGDIYHLGWPGPSSPFNDSVYYYRIFKEDWYVGGLAPVIHHSRKPCHVIHCAHLRHANPIELSEEEKYKHFRDRNLFHLWTNFYGVFTDDLLKKADQYARALLTKKGRPSNVPPPEACLMRPIDYIKELKQ